MWQLGASMLAWPEHEVPLSSGTHHGRTHTTCIAVYHYQANGHVNRRKSQADLRMRCGFHQNLLVQLLPNQNIEDRSKPKAHEQKNT